MLAALGFLSPFLQLRGEDKPTCAVLPFQAMGSPSPGLAEILAERVFLEIAKSGRYQMIERTQVGRTLKEHQISTIVSDTAAVQAGRLLGSQFVIIGSVGQLGRVTTINSRIVSVETGGIVTQAASDHEGRVEEMLGVAESNALQLLISQFGPGPSAKPEGHSPNPPAWWAGPNPDTPELVYERGASEKCSTEVEARGQAYDSGLMSVRKRITPDSALWPQIQLVGSDIARDAAEKDAANNWYAWVLVSYPRSQFEKALRRAQALSQKAQKRTPIFVCPLSFGRESEEQFPEVVRKYRDLGYGNAIWQTVEDLLYEKGFEIVTAPSSQTKSMLEQIIGQSVPPSAQAVTLPAKALLCNMNFFEIKTESVSWGSLARNSEYHAELLLEVYEVTAPHSNVKIPSKGEARDKDLLAATQKAAKQAIDKLVERVRKQ